METTSSTPTTIRFVRADTLTAGDQIVYPEDFRVLTVDTVTTGKPLLIRTTNTTTGQHEPLVALAGQGVPIVAQDAEPTVGVRDEYSPGEAITVQPTAVVDVEDGQTYLTHLGLGRTVVAKGGHVFTSDLAVLTTTPSTLGTPSAEVDALPWHWDTRLAVITPR